MLGLAVPSTPECRTLCSNCCILHVQHNEQVQAKENYTRKSSGTAAAGCCSRMPHLVLQPLQPLTRAAR
eukprot:scaffold153772_cov24-Tisochrysis_lutea.AAC.2